MLIALGRCRSRERPAGILANSVVCTVAVQRIEVITGVGRRRSYSAEEKIGLVGEARGGRGTVAAVSRRHGVCASLIYRWRRQIERGDLVADTAGFVRIHSPKATAVGRRGT